MKAVVFQFKLPGVLTVRITGSNEGRFERYCARRGVATTDANAHVPYSANVAGQWELDGWREDSSCRTITRPPAFYESVYQVRCIFDRQAKVTDASVFHEMESVADEFYYENELLDGRLDFVNAPGRFTFEIDYVSNGKPQCLKLTWWVVSEKIDVLSDAKAIKEAIEKENKGFVYAFLSQTKDRAGISSRRSDREDEWLEIFRTFVDPYVAAVKWIVHSPHLRYQPQTQFERADKIRRWTPQLSNRYQAMNSDMKERSLFRVERIEPKIDTLENRFVLFTLLKISGKLGILERLCRETKGVAEAYADRVHAWKVELDCLRAMAFFRLIGRFSGLKQESLVLQRKRGYSKIYETWVALQHAIDVTRQGIDAGNRPIWKLYEFWCYLTIRDYIRSAKTASGGVRYVLDEEQSGLGSLARISDVFEDPDPEGVGKTGSRHVKGDKKCEYVFRDTVINGRTIRLAYQKSYSNDTGADVDNRSMAHIVEQIPDIVMTIAESAGEKNSYTYLFDAKYQVMSLPSVENPKIDAAPYKTINEMHRYRDAILYRRNKIAGEDKGRLNHEVIGAYVLYPGRVDASFDYQPFISEENIGAIPLLPGTNGTVVLYKYLEEFLARGNKLDHLGTAIPPRGTELSMHVVGEHVILAYTGKLLDNEPWLLDNGYNIPFQAGKVLSLEMQKAAYLLLHDAKDPNRGKLYLVDRKKGISGMTQSEMVAARYESPTNEAYAMIHVLPLPTTDRFYGKIFDLSRLAEWNNKRILYAPQTISMSTFMTLVV